MKRHLLVTWFIAVAVALPAYFLEYRFQVLRCVHDVCQADGLLWSIGKDDTFPPGLFGPEHPLGVMGVYSRSGIPVVVGLIGGLLTPVFLIGGAIAVTLNNKPRTLIAAGVVFLILPIEYCVRIAYRIGWELLPSYLIRSPMILMLALVGSTFLISGGWVWFRKRRIGSTM